METLVLCPEELCLGPLRLTASSLVGLTPATSDYSIWTSTDLEKGTRFLPWKGTVRSDKLPVHDRLPEFDVRHRFGLYDEISEVVPGRKLRQCNWIRFLRYSLVYNEEVNVVGLKGPTGEPMFDLIKDVGPKTELVAFFVPERPEEAFLLPAIQYLRHTLFKRLIDNVLEESPLDLSTSLVASAASAASAASPSNSINSVNSMNSLDVGSSSGRKSVASDISSSTNGLPSMDAFRAAAAAAAMSSAFVKTEAAATASPIKPRRTVTPATASPPMTSETNNNSMTSTSTTTTAASLPTIGRSSSVKNGAPTRRREKNMLPCNYCGKAFDRPSLLKRHIRIHTGERPHVCDICKKGFSTSSSLNTHRRIHSGEKPHQCGVCGKRFTASSNLYYHKMTHVKEKPHKCTMCSKSFPTPGDLKSHTYVHTGTWPFKCHICHRGFSKQTNLKNHLLLHSGDKPFSCDICQKKFALSCNLRAHLKTHEAEYQNSATSLELYRRALAALGSVQDEQQHSPSEPEPEGDRLSESPDPELIEEDNEEDAEEESRSTPKLKISDYGSRMTVTV